MNKMITSMWFEDVKVILIDNEHWYNYEEQDVYEYKWIQMQKSIVLVSEAPRTLSLSPFPIPAANLEENRNGGLISVLFSTISVIQWSDLFNVFCWLVRSALTIFRTCDGPSFFFGLLSS